MVIILGWQSRDPGSNPGGSIDKLIKEEGAVLKMPEKSLVFIKPGNEERVGEIFSYLENMLGDNFEMASSAIVDGVPREKIEEHYAHLAGLDCYEPTVSAFVGKRIALRIYAGEDIIPRIREIVGNTDPQKAEPGTVRRVFSQDSLEDALRNHRYLNNVIHASDREGAEREMEIWAEYLEKRL